MLVTFRTFRYAHTSPALQNTTTSATTPSSASGDWQASSASANSNTLDIVLN